jgi:hypothetical protein
MVSHQRGDFRTRQEHMEDLFRLLQSECQAISQAKTAASLVGD